MNPFLAELFKSTNKTETITETIPGSSVTFTTHMPETPEEPVTFTTFMPKTPEEPVTFTTHMPETPRVPVTFTPEIPRTPGTVTQATQTGPWNTNWPLLIGISILTSNLWINKLLIL